jgi:hypothetical protein
MPRQYGLPFWWIIAHIDGTDVLLPGGGTEKEAIEKASWSLKGESFETKMYTTRDVSEATRRYRHDRLMQGQDIRTSISDVKHKVPQNRGQSQEIPMVDINQL